MYRDYELFNLFQHLLFRIQAKGGFFLRHHHCYSNQNFKENIENSVLNQTQRPLPLPDKLVSCSEQKENIKSKLKTTPKKVSLILKIENDLKIKNKVIKKGPGEQMMGQEKVKTGALEYLPEGYHQDSEDDVTSRGHVARPRAVELCVMSQSYTSLPLPETSLTLQHCHALSRDTLHVSPVQPGSQ